MAPVASSSAVEATLPSTSGALVPFHCSKEKTRALVAGSVRLRMSVQRSTLIGNETLSVRSELASCRISMGGVAATAEAPLLLPGSGRCQPRGL